MIFNRLDGALGAERVFDDSVLVPGRLLLHTLRKCNWFAGNSQSLGKTEGSFVPNFRSFLGMSAFFHVFGNLFGLLIQKTQGVNIVG